MELKTKTYEKPGVYTHDDYIYGFKILKCYNRGLGKWYPSIASIRVPPNAP